MNIQSSSDKCPRCGEPLSTQSLGGLCPRCLINLNFASETFPPGKDQPSVPPPSIEELAPHFPQLELLECLGRGGMGVVYKARQPKLNRLVALKILAPERERDPAFAARFTYEAQALAKLSHPCIVTIHDFGVADGLYYLLMEYVDGVSLGQLLQSGRLSPREALAIVPQICDALQYAHDHGIVHRDIKPDNILLDRQGHVKVADFGLAKLVSQSGMGVSPMRDTGETPVPPETANASLVMGTPQYMAPEQFAHPLDVDHRADIYSLGVVFYQMLTGELPKGDFAPPSKRAAVDVRLDEVVLRALEQKPELRYQQVCEVKKMCETIATAPSLSSKNAVPAAYQAWQLRKREDGRVASFVFLLLYLGLVAVLIASAPWLPERVASHFGFEGRADGWMSRSSYLIFAGAMPALIALVLAGVTALVQFLPSCCINIPRRDYWLVPERRAVTVGIIRGRLAWLLCLLTVFFGGLHALTVAANRICPPQLPMGGLLMVVILFLLTVMIWMALLLMRFAEVNADHVGVLPQRSMPEKSSGWPVGLTVGLHMILLMVAAVCFVLVVPKFADTFKDLGVKLPRVTRWTIGFSRFVQHGGFLLLPMLAAVDVLVCWLAQRLGGRKALIAWAFVGVFGLVATMVPVVSSLFLPLSTSITNLTSEHAASPVAESGPGKLVVLPAPWPDNESFTLSIKTPAGTEVGTLGYHAELLATDFIGTEFWEIVGIMNVSLSGLTQHTRVVADRDTFAPSTGYTQNNGLGEFTAEYRPGKVKLSAKNVLGQATTREIPLSATAYDNEQVLFLIRRLPLAVGYKASFPIFAVQGGAVVECRVEVLGSELKQVPAGEFQCFKTKLEIWAQGACVLQHMIYYSCDALRRVVYYDAGAMTMELMNTGAPVQPSYSSPSLGIHLKTPPGWQGFAALADATKKLLLQVNPPTNLPINCYFFVKEAKGVELKAEMQESLSAAKGYFKGYAVREESYTERIIHGLPSYSAVADYQGNLTSRMLATQADLPDKAMVEYRVYLMGKDILGFVFRAEKARFDASRPVFDKLVKEGLKIDASAPDSAGVEKEIEE